MAVYLRDTVYEAAQLALQIGSAASDAASLVADLGQELPLVQPVFNTLKAVQEKMGTVTSNREELTALYDRCAYITACVLVKCRRNSSQLDTRPLEECFEAVGRLVECCGRRGALSRVLTAESDRREIAGLHDRIGDITGDMDLAGIATVEGKVDDLKGLLHQILARLPGPAPKLAKVPAGAPARKSWHVSRQGVLDKVCESLCRDGAPRLVGLVGDSGSGKTTAASAVVRSSEALTFFSDGIIWLPVDRDAKGHLASLMLRLARIVHEKVGCSVGRPPADDDVGETYVRHQIVKGHGGRGLCCLVVADNVWEEEVIANLRDTGMWILVTTRQEELVTSMDGEIVSIDRLSEADAESVLRRAAELPAGIRLPDAAIDVVGMCSRVAMDLAFVGRWSTVRGRIDRNAWSDVADRIGTELGIVGLDAAKDTTEVSRDKRRRAILSAGFQYLAIGTDDERVQWLYLALGALPDGYPFRTKDATVLLYDRAGSIENEGAIGEVVETLERWSILSSVDGKFRMHDAHSRFARENLLDRGDVRRPAVKRWVAFISSPETLTSVDGFVLTELWAAVRSVGADDWRETRPYDKALDVMDDSEPLYRTCMESAACFYGAEGDCEGSSVVWRRLLDVEVKYLGADHPYVMNTLMHLAHCAETMGNVAEAEEWRHKEREAFFSALARMRAHRLDGSDREDDACGLKSVASGLGRHADGNSSEAEEMLRRALEIEEAKFGPDNVQVAHTLYEIGVYFVQAGRQKEAEPLLRRGLGIKEAKLGTNAVQVAYILDQLALCSRQGGRLNEAVQLLKRSLAIKETKLEPGCVEIGYTLHKLGICVEQTGQREESEMLLRRCLEIKMAKLGMDDLKVAYTLHALGVCVSGAGRKVAAEGLFKRALEIEEAKLGPDHLSVATTLFHLGVCLREVGRQSDAEVFLKRSLDICIGKLGPNSAEGAAIVAQLDLCKQAPEETE